jgi:hypothetical protein
MKHNHVAVGTIVLLHQVIGLLWYSPVLFLSPWLKAQGKTVEQLNLADPALLIVAALSSALACYAISWCIHILRIDTYKRGVGIGGLVGAGFALPSLALHDAFIGVSWTVAAIDGLHMIVLYSVAGGILAAWPAVRSPKDNPLPPPNQNRISS